MRDREFDQADCIYALQSLYKIELSEAKNIVFTTEAWPDQYERTNALREAAREAIRLLAKENSPELHIIFEDKSE